MSLRFRLAPTSLTAASRNQWQPNDGTSPQLTLLAPDDVGTGGGTATLPGVLVATISGTGGIGVSVTGKLGNGPLAATINGTIGTSGSVTASLPLLTANILGSVNAAMPLTLLRASITGFAGTLGSVAAKLPSPLAATFTVTQVNNGTVADPLTLLRATVAGTLTSQGQVTGSLRRVSGSATGLLGVTGSSAAALKLLNAAMAGYIPITGSASPLLTLLQAAIAGDVSVNTIASVLAMNLANGAVTEYQQFPFNSYAVFAGKVLAAGAGGIVELTGGTDQGAQITSSVLTGLDDFGTDFNKRVTDAYVGAKSGSDMVFSVVVAVTKYDYTLPTTGVDVRNHKAQLGKGLKHRYFQFGLANSGGADFALDSLAVRGVPLSRRVNAST
jgi:hypothetical protein